MSLSYPFPLLRELPGECLECLTQDSSQIVYILAFYSFGLYIKWLRESSCNSTLVRNEKIVKPKDCLGGIKKDFTVYTTRGKRLTNLWF